MYSHSGRRVVSHELQQQRPGCSKDGFRTRMLSTCTVVIYVQSALSWMVNTPVLHSRCPFCTCLQISTWNRDGSQMGWYGKITGERVQVCALGNVLFFSLFFFHPSILTYTSLHLFNRMHLGMWTMQHTLYTLNRSEHRYLAIYTAQTRMELLQYTWSWRKRDADTGCTF